MIKKIIWTTILISPIIIYGSISISGSGIFNSNSVFSSWMEFFRKIEWMSKDENTGGWFSLAFLLIMAFFWTAPFWYAWKGTFIVSFIPKVGLIIRILLLALLLSIPIIFDSVDNNEVKNWSIYCSMGIVILALLGLWLKS